VQGSGPRELDSTIGDILLSVADTQHGRQLIWEGFPGRGDELTVYVFYYIALKNHQSHQRYSLLDLFEQYFTLLPTYKQPGPDFEHLKPVYGYIPGRHSLNRQEAPFLRGVLPVGDAAAQQSPLTYCGFGSHIRNLNRTTSLLNYALQYDLLEPRNLGHISAFQSNVSLNWVFSRFMEPWGKPHNVNEMQNAFHGAMNELGTEMASRYFRDKMYWSDYNGIVWQMLLRYWVVLAIPWKTLGPRGVSQWITDYVRFSIEAGYAAAAHAAGSRAEQLAYRICDRISPALGLVARSRYAEWRAMGWI
jgi:lycopene cyclase CruA